MFSARWRVFKMLGIPIYLDASWLIIFFMLTVSLSNVFPKLVQQYFANEVVEPQDSEYWLWGAGAALAFFFCILLHELGHAVVGRAQGIPIRGITLFMFGGVAELGEEPPSAWSEFWMAVAGPAVSLVLAIGLGLLASLGYGIWRPELVIALGYLATINGFLILFNLVPAFPLDGGRVLRSILWGVTGSLRRATWWAANIGTLFAWLFVGFGMLRFYRGDWIGGVWLGLIALFLMNAAKAGYTQTVLRELLQGSPVRKFMNPRPIVVPAHLNLQQWVEDYVYRFHRTSFPVAVDGRLEGMIDTDALGEVPRHEWRQHQVAELMDRDLRDMTISPDADALQALNRMRQIGSSRLLVMDGQQLMGILSVKDLMGFLDLKEQLEGGSAAADKP
jgi:Zn-dependent protease